MRREENLHIIIKESLCCKAEEIQPADRFSDIKNIVETPKGRTLSILNYKFPHTSTSKAIASLLCTIFFVCGLSLLLSPDVRAIASKTINTVKKSIFVLDVKKGSYEIVQKPVDEIIYAPSFCTETKLNDTEIAKKVSFKVCFPKTFYQNFNFVDKYIGIRILKEMNYKAIEEMPRTIIEKAFTDDAELAKLDKVYGASRLISARYTNYDITFDIVMYKDIESTSAGTGERKKESYKSKKVKFGKWNGIWEETPFPDYSWKQVDNNWIPNDSAPPKKILMGRTLSWKFNGLNYAVASIVDDDWPSDDYKLSLKQAKKIAEAFMQYQKQ